MPSPASTWRCGTLWANGSGLPVCQLLGGKCREAVETYRHAAGTSFEEIEDQVRKYQSEGYRYVRVQASVPGVAAYGAGSAVKRGSASPRIAPLNRQSSVSGSRGRTCRIVPKLFEHLRSKLGDDVELLHDMHERVPPILAMQLVKDLEKFRPFFMEDPFAPEDVGYFATCGSRRRRPWRWASCSTIRMSSCR